MFCNSILTVFVTALSMQAVIALPTPHIISQRDAQSISPVLERRSLPIGDFIGDIAERTPGGRLWNGKTGGKRDSEDIAERTPGGRLWNGKTGGKRDSEDIVERAPGGRLWNGKTGGKREAEAGGSAWGGRAAEAGGSKWSGRDAEAGGSRWSGKRESETRGKH
ncbi:hypothetical protein BGZ60DRAFT_517559 [Tricladium varicosporioides]|nr:hypothetical protein BGZ60DRAFT_517559 [Hymenoscyphus varicosporioides]